jgi:hypothetical protein
MPFLLPGDLPKFSAISQRAYASLLHFRTPFGAVHARSEDELRRLVLENSWPGPLTGGNLKEFLVAVSGFGGKQRVLEVYAAIPKCAMIMAQEIMFDLDSETLTPKLNNRLVQTIDIGYATEPEVVSGLLDYSSEALGVENEVWDEWLQELVKSSPVFKAIIAFMCDDEEGLEKALEQMEEPQYWLMRARFFVVVTSLDMIMEPPSLDIHAMMTRFLEAGFSSDFGDLLDGVAPFEAVAAADGDTYDRNGVIMRLLVQIAGHLHTGPNDPFYPQMVLQIKAVVPELSSFLDCLELQLGRFGECVVREKVGRVVFAIAKEAGAIKMLNAVLGPLFGLELPYMKSVRWITELLARSEAMGHAFSPKQLLAPTKVSPANWLAADEFANELKSLPQDPITPQILPATAVNVRARMIKVLRDKVGRTIAAVRKRVGHFHFK